MSDSNRKPRPDNIPAEMKALRRWVCWRADPVKGKIPVQPDGSPAAVNDPSTWHDFDEVKDSDKMGFVFTPDLGYVAIDLDHIVVDDGKKRLARWADDLIRRMNSYAELSPSMSGVHIIVRGKKPDGMGSKFGIEDGDGEEMGKDGWIPRPSPYPNSAQVRIEVYDGGRFFTFTGWKLDTAPSTVNEINAEQFPVFMQPTRKHTRQGPGVHLNAEFETKLAEILTPFWHLERKEEDTDHRSMVMGLATMGRQAGIVREELKRVLVSFVRTHPHIDGRVHPISDIEKIIDDFYEKEFPVPRDFPDGLYPLVSHLFRSLMGSGPETIVRLAYDLFDFYLDQHGRAFAWPKQGNNDRKVIMVDSQEFRSTLAREFYEATGHVVGEVTIISAAFLLASGASEKKVLGVRCAMKGMELKIDTCDGNVITVNEKGWGVTPLDEPLFRRYPHMQVFSALPCSSPSIIRKFIDFFHLQDPDDDVLAAGFMGTSFLDIPHAILMPNGVPGAAKTTFTRAMRYVVDPSSIPVMAASVQPEDFVLQLAHNYMPCFDNVTAFREWQVDALCRAATGEGFSKRALYTDEEELIFSYRRPIVTNGVDLPSTRGDFMDRSLPVRLARIEGRQRKEDRMMNVWLVQVVPKVRGAVLQGLSRAFSIVDEVRSEHKVKPRMADFAVWGEAFCRAIGFEKDQFWNRYNESITGASTTALENDVVGELVVKMMEDRNYTQRGFDGSSSWEGTMAALLNNLKKVNEDVKLVDQKELARTPQLLGHQLRDIEANLEDAGIKIEWPVSHRKGRAIRIRTAQSNGDGQNDERTQLETVLDVFRRMCGPENRGVEEKSVLDELVKSGMELDQATKLVMSLVRNGQVYERSPGRFSLTI